MSRLFFVAWCASIFWIVFVSTMFFSNPPSEEFSYNQLGDFLAGAISPLAFLWLIVGYLQQGKAIEIQSRELRAAVEQYRAQARATESLVEHDLRLARIDFYKIVSECSAYLAECEQELGLRKRTRAGLIGYLDINIRIEQMIQSILFFNSGDMEADRSKLMSDFKELQSEQQSLEASLTETATLDFDAIERRIRRAVRHQGEIQSLKFRILKSKEKQESDIEKRESTLDQSPL